MAKGLYRKELICLNNSIEFKVESNYPVLALIIEGIDIAMNKDMYEAFKEDKAMVTYERIL